MESKKEKTDNPSASLPSTPLRVNRTGQKPEKEEKIVKYKFDGVVVSDKMDKTITVRVDRVKMQPKYKKRYTVSKKYKVHDEKNQFKEGDKVSFIECRPMSKDKRWRALYN